MSLLDKVLSLLVGIFRLFFVIFCAIIGVVAGILLLLSPNLITNTYTVLNTFGLFVFLSKFVLFIVVFLIVKTIVKKLYFSGRYIIKGE